MMKQLPFILEYSISGKVNKISGIISDYYEPDDIGIVSNMGSFANNLNYLYFTSLYLEKQINSKTIICQLKIKDGIFDFEEFTKFPFPDRIYRGELNNENLFAVNCQYEEFNNELYFLNGEKVYNIKSGEIFFELKDEIINDSISHIRSFGLINGKNCNYKNDLIVVEEELLDQPINFSNSMKYLAIYDLKTKKRLYRKFLGKSVSYITTNKNSVFVINKKKDTFFLTQFKLGSHE